MKKWAVFWLFVTFVVAGFVVNVAGANEKMIVGVVEKITFLPENVRLSAKLDTGAKTSSLGVSEMHIVDENGQKWVDFIVQTKKQQFHFHKKLEKYVKIKMRHDEQGAEISDENNGDNKDYITRPVVQMDVRIGERSQLINVNLANRQNFNYTFLLGRDAIAELGFVIDPALRYTLKKG